MVKRDFKTRYLGSNFGGLWAIINPLFMIFVYTVIFSKIMHAKLPNLDDNMAYGVYLCAGLLPWTYFSEVVGRSLNMFVEFGNFLKKVSFPRSSLPLIVLFSSTVNFIISIGIFMIFLLFTGRFPGTVIFSMIPLLAIQLAFMAGLGIMLGTLNVFFRDLSQLMGIILQFWFWFTPIVYPISILPEKAKELLAWNPIFPLITAFQNLFLYHNQPHWLSLLPLTSLSIFLLLVSLIIFRNLSYEMVDEL
jgi:lipopolysaccharide transport system permease protein